MLPKGLGYSKTSTSEILQRIKAPLKCPLRSAPFVRLSSRAHVSSSVASQLSATCRGLCATLASTRVDFAGGWLDVPRFSVAGAFVVNVAVAPLVSLHDWPFHIGGGLVRAVADRASQDG